MAKRPIESDWTRDGSAWDPNKPALLTVLLCYADILGFKQMTIAAIESGKGDRFLRRLRRSLSKAYSEIRESAESSVFRPFEMKVFTDNLVVAAPLRSFKLDFGEPELGHLFEVLSRFQSSLAADGFFVRGAIAFGRAYVDDDFAFGDALLSAVQFDTTGGAPKLSISPTVEPLIATHLTWYFKGRAPHFNSLLEDPNDGALFVNYLRESLHEIDEGGVDHDFLRKHAQAIQRNLWRFRNNKDIYAKYEWLALYHNWVCQEFIAQHPFPDPESGDMMGYYAADDARKCSDELVILRRPPQLQEPRLMRRKRFANGA